MAEFGTDLCSSGVSMNYWVRMTMYYGAPKYERMEENWTAYGADHLGRNVNRPTDINTAHYIAQRFNDSSLKAPIDSVQARTKYWVEEHP